MTVNARTPTTELSNATPPPSRTTVGVRKDVAEGVRTAYGSDPQRGDGRRPVAGLTEFHAEHRTLCPLLTTSGGRAAS